MKAQSLRKTLWLTSGILTLAVIGGAAWYFTSVRSAAAASPDDAWIKKSWDVYQQEKQVAKPNTFWPVTAPELTAHLTRPDLVEPESRIGVWPYVGPVPPAPRAAAVTGPKADEPTGLAAIGNPSMIWLQPPPLPSMVKWTFGSKKSRFFVEGEFIQEKEAKGRFKLTRIERPEVDVARYLLHYDVYDDETKDPVLKAKVAEFTLFKADDKTSGFGEKKVPPKTAAGPAKPGASGPLPADPPPLADVKIQVRNSSDNSREIEFDDAAYRYFFHSNPDSLAADVKTEEIKEGIRIGGITSGSVATQFGIQQGDIIKSINGTPVHNRSQALEVVKALPKNIDRVTVVIQRNARDIVYNIDPRDPEARKAAGKARFDGKKN